MRKRAILSQLKRLRDSDRGTPSRCMFCAARPTHVCYDDRCMRKHAFCCGEHVGRFIVDFTAKHQIMVVKL